MADRYVLSESDARALRALAGMVRDRPLERTGGQPSGQTGDEQNTPEVYVALTPLSGIPALEPEFTWGGTGTGSGTGIGAGNTPGSAECDIYRVVETNGVKDLTSADFTRTVHNLSTTAITGDTWVLAVRDKWGTWWAVPTAVGTTTEATTPVATTTGTGTGETSPYGGTCNLAGLQATDCLKATGPLSQVVYLEYSRSTNRWVSTSEMGYTHGSGTLEAWYASGALHLSLDGSELMNCGDGCFAGGALTGHGPDHTGTGTGSVLYTDCLGPVFTVCLECATCPTDAGGGATAPCQGVPFTGVVGTFTNKTGDCTCLPDNPAVSNVGVDQVFFTTTGCPGNIQLELTCVAGFYSLSTASGGIVITLVSFSASPLVLVYDISGYGANCGASGGSARLTIEV